MSRSRFFRLDAKPWAAETAGGLCKRVLEVEVRAPVSYGNLREQTGENGFPRKPTGSMFCSYRNLRRDLREFTGECSLGILYSSSLLLQECTSKDIWRQGIASRHRISLQKSLCPVVICPYLCSSDYSAPLHMLRPGILLLLSSSSVVVLSLLLLLLMYYYDYDVCQ